jgi:hypothetical protein
MSLNHFHRTVLVAFWGMSLISCCWFFDSCPAFAQESENELRKRIEKLEKVIRDHKRIMDAYE